MSGKLVRVVLSCVWAAALWQAMGGLTPAVHAGVIGACCLPFFDPLYPCAAVTPADCAADGGVYLGAGTVCDPCACCEADVGGSFGTCAPDGFVDITDSFHVLNCIDGTTPCPDIDCDINCDGVVDYVDYALPLCQFAGTCTGCTGLGPTGACCLPAANPLFPCSQAEPTLCTGLGGTYLGDGVSCTACPCTEVAHCADLNHDDIRDDNCVWWACSAGACTSEDIVFGDMGTLGGACPPDGAADGGDRFHALNCFSDQDITGAPGYPCEATPPLAYNVDAGGPFGDCSPDGVCDGNDAFHALNAFAGTSPCVCPLGAPQPKAPAQPVVMERASILLRSDRTMARPGDLADVDAYLIGPLADLRGYQLHLGITGGRQGMLELIDIAIAKRKDHVFSSLGHWSAFNVSTAQMVAGADGLGVPAGRMAYLATFTYRVPEGAHGQFVVDLRHDHADPAQRTFLFATPAGANVAIETVVPAVITVESASGPAQSMSARRMNR